MDGAADSGGCDLPFLVLARTTLILLIFLFASQPCRGQEDPLENASDEEITKEAQDPLTRLRAVAMQNNFDFSIGEENRSGYALLIQPWQAEVGTGEWLRAKSFSALPILYRPDSDEPEGGTFGVGDPEISLFWSPRKTGNAVAGVGPIVRFPLATDESLGGGKWAAGVTVVGVARPRGWLLGVRTYNLWSFAGEEDRADVNQFLLQYIVVRPLRSGWYLVSSPIVTANWEAPSGEQWRAPFGGGAGRLIRLGRRAVDLQAQVFYNVIHPETQPHAKWSLRIQLQFLFGS